MLPLGLSVFALATLLAQIDLSLAQAPLCVNLSTVDLSQTLPYFRARFPNITAVAPTQPGYLGGRNETYCCIQAVDEYLRNNCSSEGHSVSVEDRILDPTAQFPCGATWTGDKYGAPEVKVTYSWALDVCPGWQVSSASDTSQWAQLLVSFILPSVVFSFNIPRPRKLRIWEKFFPKHIGSYKVIAGFGGAVGSALIVTLDTVVWLMFSFAFAGPLLLSGLYEAQLDKRILDFLHEHIKHGKLPLALRARMLFTVLCGNLDMYPAWSDTMDLARHLDELDKQSPEFKSAVQAAPQINVSAPNFSGSGQTGPPSSGLSVNLHTRSLSDMIESDNGSVASACDVTDDQGDTYLLRPDVDETSRAFLGVSRMDYARGVSQRDETISLTRTPTANPNAESEATPLIDDHEKPQSITSQTRAKSIRKITVRLRAMLACQYSFGTTIGGPVVFFLGSFIYALLEIRSNIGDEDIAEALAFGMWWCILPHIASVAGLLLAGNNPSILEGIVSIRDLRYAVGENLVERLLQRRGTIDTEAAIRQGMIQPDKKAFSSLMESVYEAEYTPAWMWDRGKCKQDWLVVLFTDSWLKYKVNGKLSYRVREGLERLLTEGILLDTGDWIFLWFFAFVLLFIPCMFAFLTAFYTPVIGIGCRASTFLVYMGAQTMLLLLWTYYLTWRDQYWAIAQNIKQILLKPPTIQSEANLENLVNALHEQAAIDTNKPENNQRRFGKRSASVVSTDSHSDPVTRRDAAHPIIKMLFYFLCTSGFIISLFTSIGGTLMQLIGVYRNNLCLLNARDWTNRFKDDTFVTISTNTSDGIQKAERDWLILGSCSVVFLGIVCYIGWWYQKRLRAMFKEIAGKIDGPRRDIELMQVQNSRIPY